MTTTKEAALAALDAFDEKHQGPDYPSDYEETRSALVDALAEAEWEAIYAAINRLDATDDEKATLRFADWGGFEEEIEADADKTARDRLAALRAEAAENEFQIRRLGGAVMSIKTARFWIWWNESHVRVALRDGQSLTAYRANQTEEGWESVSATYTREGDTILREVTRDGRDCDGRMTVHDESATALADLGSGWLTRETLNGEDAWIAYPKWAPIDSSQRDYTAESMGY